MGILQPVIEAGLDEVLVHASDALVIQHYEDVDLVLLLHCQPHFDLISTMVTHQDKIGSHINDITRDAVADHAISQLMNEMESLTPCRGNYDTCARLVGNAIQSGNGNRIHLVFWIVPQFIHMKNVLTRI